MTSELIRKLKFVSRRWKILLEMSRAIFWYTLNISVANIYRFLMFIVTDLSRFSKDDEFSS